MARVLYLFVFFIVVLLPHGCASSGGATLKIDLQHLVARQNMPAELTDMLRDLGYDWVPIRDPHNQHGVKTVLQDDEYRMRFEYLKTRQVRIDVRITLRDDVTRLHFYEPGSETLSASSRSLLQQLQQRSAREFGETNVSF